MKFLTFTDSKTFMLCCVRWPDMAVISISTVKNIKKALI